MVMTIRPFALFTNYRLTQVLTLVLILFGSLNQQSVAATTLDKIAAIVNDDVVMLSDVYTQANRLKTQPKFSNLPDKTLLKESLELLILDSLQMQKAKQVGIIIDDAALNTTMENLAQQNGLTLEQFQVALKREGLEYSSFREKIRQRLLINELRKQQLRRNTNITNQEIDDLIANESPELTKGIEYKIQRIHVPVKTGTSLPEINKIRASIHQLRKKLISGEDKRFTDPSSITDWTPTRQLPASYVRTLALLEKGQISNVIQDPKGFHIIKLIDKRGAKKVIIEEYHSRHILIKTDAANSDAVVKSQLSEIRNQILAGADFASLAKQFSKDTGSAASGGDLGWASADTFVPAFAKVLTNTPVNQISQPFKSRFGWHILQVIEKRTIDKTEGLLRNQAKGLLNKNKAEQEYENWLKQLRNDAFVTYRIKL